MADEGLLERARRFDLAALAEIYDHYSPGVYRYAARLLGDSSLAEECTAETFSRFLLALRNGGGPQDQLQAYLYRIAHNWITDYYRRQPVPMQELTEDIGVEHDHPGLVEERIERERVRSALFSLTPDQRQVVVLRFLEGWDHEAIARALGKPVGAVKSLQHRALAALRRMLRVEGEAVLDEP
ncbi:RNA polymerase sigma factor, sigma-70 family [Anaerolinea thermolimosa]|uniref:RNA polymerase sigma factor n=1 Tax=Anaerolinea thermolimosa TaxID=229919 RepID=UPI00078653F1|nr:RNA polymerase sigma factor [Anaerolinea thermolimosa]GAP08109.1 RNA polymerase sigma factor, sigma-70 family [Anaerolinea thermolimosa]